MDHGLKCPKSRDSRWRESGSDVSRRAKALRDLGAKPLILLNPSLRSGRGAGAFTPAAADTAFGVDRDQ